MKSKKIFFVLGSALAVVAVSVVMLTSLTACDEDCQEEGQTCYVDEDEGPGCCDGLSCKTYAAGASTGECR